MTQATTTGNSEDAARNALAALREQIATVVVGQDSVVSGLVVALLCRGHVLLEGVPGVAKTLLVRTLSAALSLEFKRVQFTPDLMPGDVTGSLVYDARTAAFEFRAGPVFTNLLLADEINRTPPKTQAALLEAMEERATNYFRWWSTRWRRWNPRLSNPMPAISWPPFVVNPVIARSSCCSPT